MTAPAPESRQRHPIGVVAERTGLTQDVIRVWERRYGVVEPGRSTGGQRLYSDADIERLRLLRLALAGGRSIGGIARLDLPALRELVEGDEDARKRSPVAAAPSYAAAAVPAPEIDEAFHLIASFDSSRLDALLRQSIARRGIMAFAQGVAAPLLRRVGDEWHAGRITPAEEHLATAAVQRTVIGAIHALPADRNAPTLLVATPTGERHDIGALLTAASAAVSGWSVIYLGADLPPEEIARAARMTSASTIALSIVYSPDRERTLTGLRALRTQLPSTIDIVCGGPAASAMETELAGLGIRVADELPPR